ncbi:MAG: segregation/condensation protein A, partial [Euzebya sp.]
PQFARLRPEASLGISPQDFALIAARVFADKPADHLDLSHIQPLRMSVREAAGMILDELSRSGGPLTFDELTAGCRHVAEVVVHFLACLELYKLDHVDLDQSANFGSLQVSWTPDDVQLAAGVFDMDAYEGSPTDDEEVTNP